MMISKDNTFQGVLILLFRLSDAENEDIREFLKYVNGGKSNNPFVKELEDKITQVKANREWRLEYMTLLMRDQENQEIGREEERQEGIKKMVSALKSFGIPTQAILIKLQEEYNLTPEVSKQYL